MLETFQKELELYESNAELLKVLAHPVRLCIVKGLIERIKQRFYNVYWLKHATIYNFTAFSKIKSAKIVSSERKGLEIYYKVENETIIQLVRVLLG